MPDSHGKVELSHTLSTKEAAGRIGVSYITLRRWLANGDFTPPSAGKNGTEGFWLGDGPGKRRVWRFTSADMTELVQHKKGRELDGRGRAARIREHIKQESNSRKNVKRMIQRAGAWRPRTTEEKKLYRLLRRYVGMLMELMSKGLYPKDHELLRVRRRLGVNENHLLDLVCRGINDQDHRATAEMLGKMFDPHST